MGCTNVIGSHVIQRHHPRNGYIRVHLHYVTSVPLFGSSNIPSVLLQFCSTMTSVKRSEDQGFLRYQTSCAVIAALAGLNVGWHIST